MILSEEGIGQFKRVTAGAYRAPVSCEINGQPIDVLNGDSVLSALLIYRRHLGKSDFSNNSRAGFCLMGACQECWVSLSDGRTVRACTTEVLAGMKIVTQRWGDVDA